MIALDGGIGTLCEAAVAWSALQTEPAATELIFLGAGWPPVLRALAHHLVIDARDQRHRLDVTPYRLGGATAPSG